MLTVILDGGHALAEPRINKTFFSDVAIYGYDPVAYFTKAKAMKGSEKFAYNWSGANWYFISSDHRNEFVANPQKYAPQYGGFCVNNAAVGRESDTDPEAWTIWQGKLYLSFSEKHAQQFGGNPADYVERANANWK